MRTLDHVVWGVPSLADATAQLFSDHGLVALPGGRHPAWGTRNAVIPLSGSYVELVEVADVEAPTVGFTAAVAAAAGDGGRLCLWCLRTDDITADAASGGLHVTRGERDTPDGSMLRWRVAGMADACANPALPFIIQWDDDAAMPGLLPVTHRMGPGRIVDVDVGPDGPRSVHIACGEGVVRLP